MHDQDSSSAIDLSVSPVHLDSQAEASVAVLKDFGFDGPAYEQYIQSYCQSGPGRIIMIEASETDWSHWECHPEGDEVVVILEGSAVFIQSVDGREYQIPVRAGQTVLNPRGVWHTANIESPVKALYITPARGTEHKLR